MRVFFFKRLISRLVEKQRHTKIGGWPGLWGGNASTWICLVGGCLDVLLTIVSASR